MRVTNNMIMSNTKININGNKTNVNTLNNQMTSQKKISRYHPMTRLLLSVHFGCAAV